MPEINCIAPFRDTFYWCQGWNQVPAQLLLKHVARGPQGSRALSAAERFRLSNMMGAADGSDSEERGRLGWLRATRGSVGLSPTLRKADMGENPKGFDANSACLCVLAS